jgi:hypothetical protein
MVLLLLLQASCAGDFRIQLQQLTKPGLVGSVCYESGADCVLQAVDELPAQQCHRLHVTSCTQGTRCNEDFLGHVVIWIWSGGIRLSCLPHSERSNSCLISLVALPVARKCSLAGVGFIWAKPAGFRQESSSRI